MEKRSTKQIVEKYFENHPEDINGVIKAYYAYTPGIDYTDITAHMFSSQPNYMFDYTNNINFGGEDFGNEIVNKFSSICNLCGRSRYQIRHDNLPGECLNRTPIDLKNILIDEEGDFFVMMEKAKILVPNIIKKKGLSGETLAFLYTTHGIHPEAVAGIVDIPNSIISKFDEELEKERELSRIGSKFK